MLNAFRIRKTLRAHAREDRTPPRTATRASGSRSDAGNASGADEFGDLHRGSANEKADGIAFWFAEDDEWDFRSRRQNPDAENVERVRMHPQEISVLDGLLAPIADESKYYFTANSLTSIVTIRWKRSERGLRWDRFIRTKKTVGAFVFKKSHPSSSSSLSIHAYSECITRAKRRCAWHSSWIYDTRPMAIAPREPPNVPRYESLVSYVKKGVLLVRTIRLPLVVFVPRLCVAFF